MLIRPVAALARDVASCKAGTCVPSDIEPAASPVEKKRKHKHKKDKSEKKRHKKDKKQKKDTRGWEHSISAICALGVLPFSG